MPYHPAVIVHRHALAFPQPHHFFPVQVVDDLIYQGVLLTISQDPRQHGIWSFLNFLTYDVDHTQCVLSDPRRPSAANFEFTGYKYGYVKTQLYDNSEEIFTELLEELDKIQKSKQFRMRYFDMNDFRKVGKYIDWKGLTREINIP